MIPTSSSSSQHVLLFSPLAIMVVIVLGFAIPHGWHAVVAVDADVNRDILLHGRLIDVGGTPISSAHIQIWQTDSRGVYNHPNSASEGSNESLDENFQYFGTDETDHDGNFSFRTIKPGLYNVRPISHIHFKVWVDGDVVLTSQLYFQDDEDSIISVPSALLMDLLPAEDGNSERHVWAVNTAIVVDVGGSQSFYHPTPSQVEGPFYPVDDFFAFDNDLTTVEKKSELAAREDKIHENYSVSREAATGSSTGSEHRPAPALFPVALVVVALLICGLH